MKRIFGSIFAYNLPYGSTIMGTLNSDQPKHKRDTTQNSCASIRWSIFGLVVILACGTSEREYHTNSFSSAYIGKTEYAKTCLKALGPIPLWNCKDAEVLDVGLDQGPDNLRGRSLEALQGLKCRFPLLGFPGDGDACAPGSRMRVEKLNNGTVWALNCAQTWQEWQKPQPGYNSVQSIGQAVDGSTCFFKFDETFADSLPSGGFIDDSNDVSKLQNWVSYQPDTPEKVVDECLGCHSASAFRWTTAVRNLEFYKAERARLTRSYKPLPLNGGFETFRFIYDEEEGATLRCSKHRNPCQTCHELGKAARNPVPYAFGEDSRSIDPTDFHATLPGYQALVAQDSELVTRAKARYVDCVKGSSAPKPLPGCWKIESGY